MQFLFPLLAHKHFDPRGRCALQSEYEVQLLLEDLLEKLPDLDNHFSFTQHLFTAMVHLLQEHPSAVHNVKKV